MKIPTNTQSFKVTVSPTVIFASHFVFPVLQLRRNISVMDREELDIIVKNICEEYLKDVFSEYTIQYLN
jgi:hypothetical protein